MFVTAKEYIEKVKENSFWMGVLEMPVVNKIYEATLYVYELRSDINVYLLSKYGDINDDTKLLLNLCYVDNNHYNILYGKKWDNFKNKKTLKIEEIDKIKNDNIKFQKDLEIKLEYVKDKRTI